MKPFLRLRTTLLVVVAACALHSMAQDYVKQMPDARAVMEQMRGIDELDGKARQAAALRALQTMVSLAFSPSGLLEATPAERALMKGYTEAGSALEQGTMDALRQQDPEAPKAWWSKVMAYEQDAALREDVLTLLPAELRTRYRERMAVREQERVADSIARPLREAEQERAIAEQMAEMNRAATEGAATMQEARSGRWWMLLLGLLCLAGAVLGVVRELRPSGMDPERPGHYRVGFARYQLGSFIGTAAGTSYITSSTHHSGRDHNDQAYSYTTSTEHQRFHLVAANGDEIPVHRINSSIGVIDGNRVGVIVLNVKGRVHELAYNNYNTGLLYMQPSFITAFNSTGLLAAGAAAFLLIAYTFSGFMVGVSGGGGNMAEFTMGVIGALPVMLVYLIFGVRRANRRKRELRQTVLPALFATLRDKGTL